MNRRYKKVVLTREPSVGRPRETLIEAGFDVTVGPFNWYSGGDPTSEELINLIGDADAALVCPRDKIEARVIESCPNLQTLVCAVIGVDKMDQDAATRQGVLICNSPAPENFIGLAEATVGLIVVLMKGLKRNEAEVRAGGWYQVGNRGLMMKGRTVGLVGMGRVAQETAHRLGGWGMRLVGYDPYVDAEAARKFGVEKLSLEELLKASDVVSLHVVLTAETRNLIATRELRLMRRDAVLVNTARGGVVNEADLAQALNEGIIAGAALDVFGNEPLERDSPLFEVDPRKLIMTPHIIGHCQNVEAPGFEMAVATIRSILDGEVPQTVINRKAVDRWRARFHT
ncbi:MAG TPA: NAD(P)-dependent oxidoreductase [Candidatus Binataceae bacterium]|nr:NAD(P)-dependent oxidoreductase [Candidatus Binataceae bacterium]